LVLSHARTIAASWAHPSCHRLITGRRGSPAGVWPFDLGDHRHGEGQRSHEEMTRTQMTPAQCRAARAIVASIRNQILTPTAFSALK
jgi:hypothetical protein